MPLPLHHAPPQLALALSWGNNNHHPNNPPRCLRNLFWATFLLCISSTADCLPLLHSWSPTSVCRAHVWTRPALLHRQVRCCLSWCCKGSMPPLLMFPQLQWATWRLETHVNRVIYCTAVIRCIKVNEFWVCLTMKLATKWAVLLALFFHAVDLLMMMVTHGAVSCKVSPYERYPPHLPFFVFTVHSAPPSLWMIPATSIRR